MSSRFRTVLVIGENHRDIAAKYSADTKVGKYERYELNQAPKLHREYIKSIEATIRRLEGAEEFEKIVGMYRDMLEEYREMDDFEFFQVLTSGCEYDKDGNALSDENPDAHYQFEKCYDDRIRADQRFEAPFSDPLILKDGTKAYSAKAGDVDWPMMHMRKAPLYRVVWEVCVDGRPPENEDEETAYKVMNGRTAYFANFKDKEEYAGHCSAFWTYGVATEEGYTECGGNDIEWTNGFYDRFVKGLEPSETVSIYEVKLLD